MTTPPATASTATHTSATATDVRRRAGGVGGADLGRRDPTEMCGETVDAEADDGDVDGADPG